MTTLFPMIQPEQVAETGDLPLYREVAWDFLRGRPLFRSGEPMVVTGIEAIRVWCWKALKTERARYEIYSWDFGSELESLIGQPYTDELKRSEAARYVREALEINPYITDISRVKVEFQEGHLEIWVQISTIYGEVTIYV